MGALATLLSWLNPVLHPLTEFRSQVAKLGSIHQSSVQTFGGLAGGLVGTQAGPDAFTGELSDAFWTDVQTYLNAENELTGAGVGVTEVGVVEEAAVACETCATEVTGAVEVAATEVAGDVVLDEVTGIVDAAAVAEVGANPIADVAAVILTLVAGAALIVTLTKLAWDIYNAVHQWQHIMNTISNTPLPKLPSNPTPVPGPTTSLPPINMQQLTPQQQQRVQDLLKKFPGASQSDIENMVKLGYDDASIATFIQAGLSKHLTIEQINSMLANIAANTRVGVPLGFKSLEDFQSFGSQLCSGLNTSGYSNVTSGMQGSAITGVKYTTGQPFDVGRTSDFDIALASPELLAKAKALGIPLRSGGVRTGPLNDNQLRVLGLYQLAQQLKRNAGRKVSFMIYDSILTAVDRAPTINIPCGP